MTKVSVIVPVYNVEKYIKKCLDSLVNQTFNDYEIIVVNDGSPDNSQKIIDEYKRQYPNLVKSFIKENGGQGSARNLGINKAKGKYVMFVDSDDYIEKTMIEELYKKIIKDKSEIVICNDYIVFESGNKIENTNELECFTDDNAYLFCKPAVWNKIFEKKLIIDNNILFREKLWYEDFDFTIKIYGLTNKISYLNKPLYNYLQRAGSTMNNSNVRRNLEIIQAMDEIINFYKEKNIYTKYYSELEFLALYNVYISTIVRIINSKAKRKLKNESIKIIIKYMHDNFEKFENNKYITKFLDKNKQIILNLIKKKKYYIINIIFKIKKIVRR